MWHPQSDEAHGEEPMDPEPWGWLFPWVFPIGVVTLGVVLLLIGAFD